MKRKLINLGIACVLIVASVLLFVLRGSAPIAHENIYVNERISNMAELYHVTGFVVDGLAEGVAQPNEKYFNATVHITLSEKIKLNASVSGMSGEVDAQMQIEQDLTLYLTKDGIFVESQAVVFEGADNEFDSNSKPTKGFAKYNVNIYLTEDKAYIKFMEYDSASNVSSAIIKPDYVNVWVETTKDVAMSFLPLSNETEVVANAIFGVLGALLRSGDVKQNDIIASFDEDSLVHLDPLEFGDLDISDLELNRNKYKESLKFDISDPTRPYIVMGARYKDTIKTPLTNRWSYVQNTKVNIVAAMEMVIYNINNTVIDWPPSVNSSIIKAPTESDFEKLFAIKVYEVVDDE